MFPVDSNPDEKTAFQRELQVMKMLKPHANIVTLLGVCTKEGDVIES